MAVPKLSVEMELKLKKFQDELAKTGGLATKEGKAIGARLSRELKATLKASEAAGESLKKTGKSTEAAGLSANKALKALGPLGGVLTRLSPEAGAAASSIAGLTGGMEGMLAAGAPIAGMVVAISAVVALGAIEFAKYREEQEQLAAIVEDHRVAEEARKPILEDTRLKLIDIKVAAGELTEEQGELEKASMKAAASINEVTAASLKQLVALNKQRDSWSTTTADAIQPFVQNMGFLTSAFDVATTTSDELNPRIRALSAEIGESTAAAVANLRVTKESIKTSHARKDAVEAETQATKDREAADKAAANALAKLSDIEQDALGKGAIAAGDAYTKIDVAREKSLRAALDALDSGLASEAVTRDQQVELFAQYTAAVTAIDAQASEERAAQAEVDAADAKKAAEERIKIAEDEAEAKIALHRRVSDVASQAIGVVAAAADLNFQNESSNLERLEAEYQAARDAQMAGEATLTADQMTQLSNRVSAQRSAVQSAYDATQAARYSEAFIATAAATINAYNDGLAVGGPAGLILGPAMAAVALAAGGVQVAAIASETPSFNDTPGVMRNQGGRSRVPVSLAGDDYWAAAKSPADLRAQVGGGSGATTILYKHRPFNYFIDDNLRMNGSLAREMRRGDRVGQVGRGRRG